MVLYLYRDYKVKRVWNWLIKPADGPANFQGIELDIVQFPDNRFDCWVDGKHCPDTVADLKTVNEKNLSGLAGQPVEILEIRG